MVAEPIHRAKNGRKGIRLDKWIGRNLRQCGCVYVELLPQLVSLLLYGSRRLDLRWLIRLRSWGSVHAAAPAGGRQAGNEEKQNRTGPHLSACLLPTILAPIGGLSLLSESDQ
jgi:hypothetical protein